MVRVIWGGGEGSEQFVFGEQINSRFSILLFANRVDFGLFFCFINFLSLPMMWNRVSHSALHDVAASLELNVSSSRPSSETQGGVRCSKFSWILDPKGPVGGCIFALVLVSFRSIPLYLDSQVYNIILIILFSHDQDPKDEPRQSRSRARSIDE